MAIRNALAVIIIVTGLCGSAQAAVAIADFENNSLAGWGTLTNTGFLPPAAPISQQIITGSVGTTSGSKVLELSGNAAFNFGQPNGAALGFDFLSQNLLNAFLTHDRIEFDWVAPPSGSPSGFSQLFNIILNSETGGFTTIAGSSQNTPETNQFYFTGYNGVVHHVVLDYTAYKNTIINSGNPNNGGAGTYLQFGIQPNAGGGAPAVMHFDNFTFTSVPEPSALALVGLGGLAVLARRRRA